MPTFFIKKTMDDKECGPFTAAKLKELVSKGQVKRNHLISKDKKKWVTAEKVRGLALAEPAGSPSKATKPIPTSVLVAIAMGGAIGLFLLIPILSVEDPNPGSESSTEVQAVQKPTGPSPSSIRALAKRGKEAIPELLKHTQGEDPSLAIAALKGLGDLGEDVAPALPHLVKTLSHSDRSVALAALSVLEDLPLPPSESLPDLEKALYSQLDYRRSILKKAQDEINAQINAQWLKKGYKAGEYETNYIDKHAAIRAYALRGIVFIAAKEREGRTVLFKYIRFLRGEKNHKGQFCSSVEEYPDLYNLAYSAVLEMGPPTKDLLPDLIAVMHERWSRANVRTAAHTLLRKLAREDEAALDKVFDIFEGEPNLDFARTTIPKTPAAIERLVAVFHLNPVLLRQVLCEFPLPLVAAQSNQLWSLARSSNGTDERVAARELLKHLGPYAKAIAPQVLNSIKIEKGQYWDKLSRSERDRKKEYIEILESMGPEASQIIPELVSIFENHSDIGYKYQLLDIFRSMKRDAVPALHRLLKGDDYEVAKMACESLSYVFHAPEVFKDMDALPRRGSFPDKALERARKMQAWLKKPDPADPIIGRWQFVEKNGNGKTHWRNIIQFNSDGSFESRTNWNTGWKRLAEGKYSVFMGGDFKLSEDKKALYNTKQRGRVSGNYKRIMINHIQ